MDAHFELSGMSAKLSCDDDDMFFYPGKCPDMTVSTTDSYGEGKSLVVFLKTNMRGFISVLNE